MVFLYALCAKEFAFFQALIEYCKTNSVLTGVMVACILLCLIAVFLLIAQSKALAQEKQRAEDAVIFLQRMDKEHQAKQIAEEHEKAQVEEKRRRQAEKVKDAMVLKDAPENAPDKYCLFCGKINHPKAVFCEECACKEFGSWEEYLNRKEKTELQLARKQEVREARKRAEIAIGVSKATKYSGKWVVVRMYEENNESNDGYFFELLASNGEKLLSSEEYTSYTGAMKGIETHKSNILSGNFRITLSKKGDYIFKLLTGKNTLLCTGGNYPSRAGCESAIESVKRFAETAVIAEELQEIPFTLPPEDNSPLPELAEGHTGKWVIGNKSGADCETSFYFELFANNGEKLLSSEEYTSYIGAINGITTHKKNIEAGNFRIALTKRGDFIVKLLNGNGQLLCLGEHYKTKRLGQNAVESIKRFALASPVLTDSETAMLIRKK